MHSWGARAAGAWLVRCCRTHRCTVRASAPRGPMQLEAVAHKLCPGSSPQLSVHGCLLRSVLLCCNLICFLHTVGGEVAACNPMSNIDRAS